MHLHSLLITLLILEVHGITKEKGVCRESKENVQHPVCRYTNIDKSLVCFSELQEEWLLRQEDVLDLVLCDWREKSLNPEEVLKGFSSLRSLAVVGGNLSELTTVFPELKYLERVNITDTKLRSLPDGIFLNLPSLKVADLTNNSLAEIPVASFATTSLEHLYLSENPLRCSEDTSWILQRNQSSLANRIADRERLQCAAPYEGRPLVAVVEIIMRLKEECKETVCDCELVYVVGRVGKQTHRQLMAFVSVNCSHRYLTEMPAFLPANTTTLRLTGNKINDLSPLISNKRYNSVVDLYLDDNIIESIVQLDGSYWLDHFRLLSLRGNRLSDLPTYALENVLLQSGHAASLYLGNNPWRCDCSFTPGFQDLLIRYTNLVKDINDVKCDIVYGDENSGKQIRDLTRTEICISPEEDSWLHPLDVLNIVLACLIFLVLGKLLYDYWCFKKTGKLPWIVAKIP